MNPIDIKRLYELIDAGKTQEEVARFLGVSRRTVYRRLLARKYVRLSRKLGIEP